MTTGSSLVLFEESSLMINSKEYSFEKSSSLMN